MVVVFGEVLPRWIFNAHSSCKLQMKGFSSPPLSPCNISAKPAWGLPCFLALMEIINYNEFAITALVPTTILFPKKWNNSSLHCWEWAPPEQRCCRLRSWNGAFFTQSATRVTERHLDIKLPWMHSDVVVMLLSVSKWLIRWQVINTPINTSESKATLSKDHLWFCGSWVPFTHQFPHHCWFGQKEEKLFFWPFCDLFCFIF